MYRSCPGYDLMDASPVFSIRPHGSPCIHLVREYIRIIRVGQVKRNEIGYYGKKEKEASLCT
jgi:hypothetical protein